MHDERKKEILHFDEQNKYIFRIQRCREIHYLQRFRDAHVHYGRSALFPLMRMSGDTKKLPVIKLLSVLIGVKAKVGALRAPRARVHINFAL